MCRPSLAEHFDEVYAEHLVEFASSQSTARICRRELDQDEGAEFRDEIPLLEKDVCALQEDVSKPVFCPRVWGPSCGLTALGPLRCPDGCGANAREHVTPMFPDVRNGECQVEPVRRMPDQRGRHIQELRRMIGAVFTLRVFSRG